MNAPTNNKVQGLHHLAISTGDIKRQIAFFTDALGMELVALYWMHGAKGAMHAFLRMNDESSIAFVYFPENTGLETTIGHTHPGNPAGTSAPGTMQHIALKARDMDEMVNLRDRLRSRGVPVLGPIDHGFCQSMYFAGPEHLSLEIACGDQPINAKAWIDPDVTARCGISDDELRAYTQPSAHDLAQPPHPQPGPDSIGPHMAGYADGAYEHLIALDDAGVMANMSETKPPVGD